MPGLILSSVDETAKTYKPVTSQRLPKCRATSFVMTPTVRTAAFNSSGVTLKCCDQSRSSHASLTLIRMRRVQLRVCVRSWDDPLT